MKRPRVVSTCSACGAVGEHYSFANGRPHPRCVSCCKNAASASYYANPAAAIEAVSRYRRTPRGRLVARAASRKSSARPEERARAAARIRALRASPETGEIERARAIARHAVRVAVRSGALSRPAACESCGSVPARDRDGRPPIQFHHAFGYERESWLKGEWLCRPCHATRHGLVTLENVGHLPAPAVRP